MSPDERHAMTIAVAQAYIDHTAQQYEQMGFTKMELYKVKDRALERFNEWHEAITSE